MSKNMTRKGLALGATLALATTGLVATPAFANSVVTSLASGTSFNSVVGYGNELKLSTVMSPGLSGNEGTLHYRISNPSGAALEIGVGRTSTSSGAIVLATAGTSPTSNTAGIWGYQNSAAAYSDVDADSADADFQTALTDFVVVPLGTRAGVAADENFITVGVIDATAVTDVTVTVTAWLDTAANASNVQDTVEVTGNTVTLNFYDPANVKATTTMVAPVTGATSVSAETVTTPELNGQQLGADFIDVDFTAQGNANAVLAENTSSDAAVSPTKGGTTYSGTTKKWTSTAYLAYSVATDAWRGSNGTINGLADLLAVNVASDEATVAVANSAAETVTMAVFPHGLPENFTAGTFAATFDDLDSAAAVASNSDFIAKPLTYVSASSVTWAPTGATELGYTTINTAAEDVTGGAVTFWSVGAFSTVQASGVYSARAYIGATALGAVGSSTNSGITASDTRASVAVSENVQGVSNRDASGSAPTVKVRTGTTSVTATATIYYTDALDFDRVKKVGAGIPVTGTLSSATGTFQINSAGAGVTSSTVLTDANGQVTFTVTTTTASSTSNAVTLAITPQSVASNSANAAEFAFDWDDAAYTLYDTNSSVKQPTSNASSYRFMNAGGVMNFNFALLDQWGKAAPDASWRLQVVNSGRTVSSDTHSLSNGRVSVNVADGAQGAGSTITTTVNVQKLSAGTWSTQAAESWDGTDFGTVITNVAAASDDTITLDADGAQLYASSYVSATNADLSSTMAADDVVAQDRRLSAVAQPTYTNDVVVNGRVTNKLTGVAKGGTRVTITGDSSILFSSGDVDAFGSITVMADADGDFTVRAYSNKAQKDSVITITTANSGSKTQKITFEPAAAVDGENLVITATSAEPGKTVIFTGKLTDYYGNPVDTDQTDTNAAGASTLDAGDARLTVTYSGPGLISGSLPVETGADGTFTVRVLLGSNDTGTATVSATYGAANGTISAADTGLNIDVKSALTVTIGKAVSTTGKVNVGSFNGKLVVYASNLNGARISWKVGGNWGSQVAASNYAIFNRPTPRAGVTVSVDIYVNGVKTLTKSVVTR